MISTVRTAYNTIWPVVQAAASHFNKANLFYKVDLFYNIFQPRCTQKADTSPEFFNWLDKKSIFFILGDMASILVTGSLLMKNIDRIEKTRDKTLPSNESKGIYGLIIFFIKNIVLSNISFLTVSAINELSESTLINPKFKNARWNRPKRDKLKQILYEIRIIINICLLFFSRHQVISGISTALELFSLAKVTQRKWIGFNKEIGFTNSNFGQYANSAVITYSFLLQTIERNKLAVQPQDSENELDPCAICLYDETPPDSLFCLNHSFHQDCLLEFIDRKANSFANDVFITITGVINYDKDKDEDEEEYIRYDHSVSYEIEMPRASLPCCPLCRGTPDHNGITVEINNKKRVKSSSHIHWKD